MGILFNSNDLGIHLFKALQPKATCKRRQQLSTLLLFWQWCANGFKNSNNVGTCSASWEGYNQDDFGDHVYCACVASAMLGKPCKRIQNCCATLRRSRNKRKVGNELSVQKFDQFQTLQNNSKQHPTTCNRVVKIRSM